MGGESPRNNGSCQSVIINGVGGGGMIINQSGGSNQIMIGCPPPPIFIPQNYVPPKSIREYTKIYRGQDLRGKKVRFDIVK